MTELSPTAIRQWSVPTLTTTMAVRSHWDDMLKLAVEVDVKIPCPLVSLEVYDQKASHLVDIQRSLEMKRLTSAGEALPTVPISQQHRRATGADAITGPGDPDSESLFQALDTDLDGFVDGGEVPAEAIDRLERAAAAAASADPHARPVRAANIGYRPDEWP